MTRDNDPRQLELPEQICPICGTLLHQFNCKLICPAFACGYRSTCDEGVS